MLNMCDLAYEVTARSLILCCVMLFSAFMLLVDAGGYTAATYSTYRLAQSWPPPLSGYCCSPCSAPQS